VSDYDKTLAALDELNRKLDSVPTKETMVVALFFVPISVLGLVILFSFFL